jgi:putative chitinase
MDFITAGQLAQIFPACRAPQDWVTYLNPAFERFFINTKDRIAAFLGQTGHESGQFNTLEENLNYRAARLLQVWPKRFETLADAQPFEKQPQKLANYVYANRIGNGPPDSNDGYTYRGRGIIQITGRSHYAAVSVALGQNFIAEPDRLKQPEWAALSAAWFWQTRGLNELADDRTDDDDQEDFIRATRIVNGGTAGLQERYDLYWTALQVL